jgi:MoaA/NifB/PqqE/SkfB family radical SAM enzyme
MLTHAFKYPHHPVNVHLIPIRRCNLSCAYCNEYDDVSKPVPIADLFRRIDRLAALGTGIVTLSGGEPLLHPELDAIIGHIRRRDMIATLITNAYLINRDRIRTLNHAGLDHLQISIDNVVPDDVSKKSLKLLDQKLEWLAEEAEFDITINSVVGAGIRNPDDALVIAQRAKGLGFSITVGIVHDHHGQLAALGARHRRILEAIVRLSQSTFDFASYNRFQKNLSEGQPNEWRCRAGCRYLYVCEDGLVHWCSQQRGRPGVPLEQYGPADLEREHETVKGCEPFCTIGCVHRVAQLDELREHPLETMAAWFSSSPELAPRLPVSVQVLRWMFITGSQRTFFRNAALRLFGAR